MRISALFLARKAEKGKVRNQETHFGVCVLRPVGVTGGDASQEQLCLCVWHLVERPGDKYYGLFSFSEFYCSF